MSAINDLRDPSTAAEPGARVLPLRRGPTVAVLPEDDLERIHAAALRVLAKIGVEVGSVAVLERLDAAGARTNAETGRVHFPTSLVEEALRSAPRGFLLAARDPAGDLRVDGTAGWLSTGGRASPRSSTLRTTIAGRSTEADVDRRRALGRRLPQIGFLGPSVTALDVPAGARPSHELHVRFANTSKHVQLASAVECPRRRGRDRDRRGSSPAAMDSSASGRCCRPSCAADRLSRYEGDGLEAAVTYRGGRCSRVGSCRCRSPAPPPRPRSPERSSPPTPRSSRGSSIASAPRAGRAARSTAPARIVADPGGGEATSGGPQDVRFQMAWIQLARRLGLPRSGRRVRHRSEGIRLAGRDGGRALGDRVLDERDPTCSPRRGCCTAARVFSPAAMLLDTELFDLVRQVPLGFEVDEETLALEVIEKVGPGEHFLGEPHTLRHMREAWTSRFMDKDTVGGVGGGRPAAAARARRRARPRAARLARADAAPPGRRRSHPGGDRRA